MQNHAFPTRAAQPRRDGRELRLSKRRGHADKVTCRRCISQRQLYLTHSTTLTLLLSNSSFKLRRCPNSKSSFATFQGTSAHLWLGLASISPDRSTFQTNEHLRASALSFSLLATLKQHYSRTYQQSNHNGYCQWILRR